MRRDTIKKIAIVGGLNPDMHGLIKNIIHDAEQKVNKIKSETTKFISGSGVKSSYSKPYINESKVGRNDLCLCGSGKKAKKCCL